MDWSKAKNIIILLLCVVNLFLLGNIVYSHLKNEADERNTVTELMQYLSAQNIQVEESVIPQKNLNRSILIIARDSEAERITAQDFFRESTLALAESGIYLTGDGSLSYRASGYFEILLGADFTQESALARLRAFDPDYLLLFREEDVMRLQFTHDQLPIFNSIVTITRMDEGWHIAGRLCTGTIYRANQETERGVAGVLLGVTSQLLNAGVDTITGISPGWSISTISGVGVRLTPVYCVDTNAGSFYINTINGQVELI